MEIQCDNYEISVPHDASEGMLTFAADDILQNGVIGGDPTEAVIGGDRVRARMADGTWVVFPHLTDHLRALLLRHTHCWICGMREAHGRVDVVWAALLRLQHDSQA